MNGILPPLKPIAIKERNSIAFLRYGELDVIDGAFVLVDKKGVRKHIPVGGIACLMLEPGTRVSHAATVLAARAGTLLIWVGASGVRLYAAGQPGGARSDRLLYQAKLALDAGRTNEALRLLSSARMEKKPLAAVIRAEAYRQQSVAAARRAGHYAHAVSEDIHKLEKARFNAGLAQAEKRLQAFMSGHAAIEPVRTGHVIAANTKTSKSRLPDSVRLAINAWRNDWESRHADAYLSHYDRDFRTIKYNYTSWSSYKRHINSRKKYISVTLSDLKLIRGPEKIPQGEGILVTFKQRYKSSNYAANSRKQLYLVRRGNHDKWLIMYEGEASRPYHPPHTKAAGQISLNISLNSTNVLKIARTGSWAINLGSFDSAANAEQMASGIHLTSSQRPFVSSASIHGKAVHRVRIGLYQSRNDAVDAMIKICPELGLTDCWLEQVKK